MAKLLAFYNLCPINSLDDFLGLSRDVDPGCVINTLGRNIVLVVKLSNQRQIRSWTVVDRLSSKVVYDQQSDRYVGVFGGRYIRCWSKDVTNINAVKKVKLYRNVHELFALETGQTLVLYDDGTCESLPSALMTRNRDRLNPDYIERHGNVEPDKGKILEVCTVILHDGTVALTYFVTDVASGVVTLWYGLLGKEDLKPVGSLKKLDIVRPGGEIKLAGCCVVENADGPTLVSIWSDQRLFMIPISFDDNNPLRSVGSFITLANSIKVNQPLSLIGISKDYIAIYASNLHEDGAALLLFNVQFKVSQAKQFFKVYFRSSRFWVMENNILLAFGQTLAVVPFKISKEQLSDMIGSQRTLTFNHAYDDESINEDYEFIECVSYGGCLGEQDENKEQCNGDTPVVKPVPEPNPYNLYESDEHFAEALQAACRNDFTVDIVSDPSLPVDSVQLNVFNNFNRHVGPPVLSDRFNLVLEEMERSGYSEQEITDRMIPLLVQANSSQDLLRCLTRYQVVSEKSLVVALKYALMLETDADVYSDLLNVTLSCSFDRSSMVPIIKNELDLTLLQRLLDHLTFLLRDADATLTENPQDSDNFDSDEKVVVWIMLLLDTHYQQLILANDNTMQERLETLLSMVRKSIESLRELRTVEAMLHRILEHGQLGLKICTNRWYTIEMIDLYKDKGII